VIFGNVRELALDTLAVRGDEPKLVIDFPFDEAGFTPNDDIAHLDEFRAAAKPARTLVWLPSFFSLATQRDLATLVKLDYLLAGERLRDYATHLSPVDQASAREILRNQQSQLRQRLIHCLEGAYGVESPLPGSIDESHTPSEHFQSLDPAFAPRPPDRANLRPALESLLGQMFTSQYPAHPEFGVEIKTSVLRKVHEQVSRALQDPDGRVAIDKPLRALMSQIAVPLRLGEMGETHFVRGRHWFSHFDRLPKPLSVGKLRQAIDDPRRMGLPAVVQNLVILTYADQANLSFWEHGGPASATLEKLPDDLELREEALPASEVWQAAAERAGKVFGIAVSPLLNASNVSALAEALGRVASGALEACAGVAERLERIGRDVAIDAEAARRLRTARATHALVRALSGLAGKARIDALANMEPQTSLDAMGTSFRRAQDVLELLRRTKWELFEAIARLGDARAERAGTLRRELAEVLAADEYAVELAGKLPDLETQALRLLTPPITPDPTPVLREGTHRELDREALARVARELDQLLSEQPGATLTLDWTLRR